MLFTYLPDTVNITVADGGLDSYFDVTIDANTTFLSSIYDAWCIDLDTGILHQGYTANVYSIYETIPFGLVERPENLDLVNWIINQDYSNYYTEQQIQDAIWSLVELDYDTIDPGSLVIVQEASLYGEGFIPSHGDDIGVILAPIPDGGKEGDAQVIIIEIPVPNPAIDIEKFTNGGDADTVDHAVRLNPGEDLSWLYQVTNIGNIPFPIADISVVDDLEGTPTFLTSSDAGADGILSPGEKVLYEITAPHGAENLMRSLDFETRPDGTPLSRGDLLADAYADWGITISTDVDPDAGTDGPFPAMVFDTANPTGGDSDLGSPHTDVGGPGVGIGGGINSPYRNDRDLGNIAIISEDGDINDPDDHESGGTLRIDFETPVSLEWAEILDASETGAIVTFDETGIVINEYVISPDAENDPFRDRNNFQSYAFNQEWASAIEFQFADSAGLANIVFTEYYQNTATVTVPGHDISDDDTSTYITENPSITLEKSTNGKDADTLEQAAIVPAGDAVNWRYDLHNKGNVAFNGADISVVDDQGVVLTLDDSSDISNDGILSPGEQWTYVGNGIAEELSFAIDFDSDAAGNSLAAGTRIDTEYQDIGISISTPGHAHGAMIFDTAHITGNDWDLLDPNLKKDGNELLDKVLILSEDGNTDNPDDNAEGGIMRVDFDELVGISGVTLLDIDADESVEIRTFDAWGTLLETSVFEGAGNNMLQTAEVNSGLIGAMEIELTGSGAIAGLEGDRFYSNTATATIADRPGITASDLSFYVNAENSSVLG